MDAARLQQRDEPQEHLGRHERIAHRRVAAHHGHVETLGNRLQPVRLLVRVHHGRQQQGVEHRLVETHAGGGFFQLQKAHVECGVVRDQHGVGGKGVKSRQHLGNRGLAGHHLGLDAVDRNRRRRDGSLRIDELLKTFRAQQLAVDDARRTDLDDLVALGRVEPRRLGVEDRVAQFAQKALVELAALRRGLEQIEVVVLRPAVAAHKAASRQLLLRAGQGQQKAEEGLVAHALALEPELAAVALNHVAHRHRRAVGADLHRIGFPAHHGLGAHRLAGPQQVEVRAPAGCRRQAQLDQLDLVFAGEPAGQVGQCLKQREAVDLEPQRAVDLRCGSTHTGNGLDAPQPGRDQVRAQHVLQRPACLHALCGAVGQVADALAHRADLVANDTVEALAHGRFQVGVVEHLDGRLKVAERRPAALGQPVQQLVARGFGFEVAGDVVQHQHEAAEDGLLAGLANVAHRRHLRAQQLPAGGGGDELGRRAAGPALQALLDIFQRVGHQLAIEHRVDRPAQAHQFGPAGPVR